MVADLTEKLNAMGKRAAIAARALRLADSDQKNAALKGACDRIDVARDEILEVNAGDVSAARSQGKDEAFIDRMTLDGDRIDGICEALHQIAAQPDPVGAVISQWSRPNGLQISRIRTPIGVIGVIYESRPNVTIDAAAIAIKAGNAVILRGGSECLETSARLFQCFHAGCLDAGMPDGGAQFVDSADRAAVGALLGGLGGAIDLVIPRGGKSLVARVRSDARVPVLSHLDGICHVYIDREASLEKAVAIALNSKMRRPGVCGAAETLLIDRAALEAMLAPVAKALRDAGCALRGDDIVCALDASIDPARESDWASEYLAPIISIAAVEGVAGAVDHIARYSSGHTESIVTQSSENAQAFLAQVDSAIVLHNASTQFADGGEFGFGAEIGIATGRLHARGPVGVEELTTYKNIVKGSGQIRP